jgi:hypothetical protein
LLWKYFFPSTQLVVNVPSNRLYLECTPATVPSNFICLGYDIANASMFSGMCNCGYSDDELGKLLPVWSTRINEHGLITNFQDAEEFRDLTEQRTGEHGPFFVYAIHGEENIQ